MGFNLKTREKKGRKVARNDYISTGSPKAKKRRRR